jgi:hypothetical protein
VSNYSGFGESKKGSANATQFFRASLGTDKNPLAKRPPQEVISFARSFYKEKGLLGTVSESVLVKGALYIRDPVGSMIFAKVRLVPKNLLAAGG